MANITQPGFWLVQTASGGGIVHYTLTGQTGGNVSAKFITADPAQLTQRNVGAVLPNFYEAPPDTAKKIIESAKSHGVGAWKGQFSNAVAVNDLLIAAAAVGAFVGSGVLAGAGLAVGGGEAAAGGEAAGTAAESEAGGAAGGAAGAAAGGAASKVAGKLAGAVGALSVGALFTRAGLWGGVGMLLAGAVLVLLGILQLAGINPGQVKRAIV